MVIFQVADGINKPPINWCFGFRNHPQYVNLAHVHVTLYRYDGYQYTYISVYTVYIYIYSDMNIINDIYIYIQI